MTEGVKQAFLMEREFQSQAEISSKSRVDGYDDFIFVNRYGDVQNQGNLNKALRRMMRDCNDEILEKYGADSDPVLLPQFSCHILRHTFATRLSSYDLSPLISVSGLFLFLPLLHLCDVIGAFFIPERWSKKFF